MTLCELKIYKMNEIMRVKNGWEDDQCISNLPREVGMVSDEMSNRLADWIQCYISKVHLPWPVAD